MWPVASGSHQTMPHRIVVNIIDMRGVIGLVANHVLPEPSLPDGLLTLRKAARVSVDWRMGAHERLREPLLDETPSQRIFSVTLRERPDGVNMVGQDDERIDVEWMSSSDPIQTDLEAINGPDFRKDRTALVCHYGEEVGGTGDFCPSISHD